MKELHKILRRIQELQAAGEPCALATVVSVRGSAYRRPGARMLFSGKGREIGFVSAACLESDIFEKAKEVIAQKTPTLISYDTTAPEDAIFGIGQGCGGYVELLIEPMGFQHPEQSLVHLQSACNQIDPCALATIVKTTGSTDYKLGAKYLVTQNNAIRSPVADKAWDKRIVIDAEHALLDMQSGMKHYALAEGTIDVFIEIHRPSTSLMIFGATPDVKPLVHLAAELHWDVSVIDHRSLYAVTEDFPDSDAVLLLSPDEYAQHLHLSSETFAVVMIHQFEAEIQALRFLFPSPIRYIGLLGPKSKCELLLQRLATEGFTPSEEQLAKLHNPIGLDLGAETAEEIAVSIIAEIQSIANGRKPAFLKDRQGPIHNH